MVIRVLVIGYCVIHIMYFSFPGADPTIEDNAGYLPADYCTNHAVKDILKEYTTKV